MRTPRFTCVSDGNRPPFASRLEKSSRLDENNRAPYKPPQSIAVSIKPQTANLVNMADYMRQFASSVDASNVIFPVASSLRLFEEFDRTYKGIASRNEDTLSFLDRSAWQECHQVRAILETFYNGYPEHQRARLMSRLRAQFDSAFFELFLHELLLRHGCEVVVEPALANTKSVPDFSARFQNGNEVIVEATVATDSTNEERARDARMEGLHREIDCKLPSSDFWICLGEATTEDLVPPSKDIIRFIRAKLASLSWESMSEELRKNPRAIPTWNYKGKAGFEIEISAIPKSVEIRGKSKVRTVGAIPGAVRWGGSSPALKKSITDKCSKYGRLEIPFVVAVNAISKWGTGPDDVEQALFGAAKDKGRREAVWIGPQGPRNTGLSAVLLTKVWPWNIASSEVRLYHNPFARSPCRNLHWKIPQSIGEPPNAKPIDGITPKELFDLA